MSINCQNYICTRTLRVHKCRQINSQKQHPRHTTKTTRKSPSQICVSSRKTANQTNKGARAQTTKPTTRICQGTQRTLPLCQPQKHAQINYPPRHSVRHRKRNTACSFVTINENCTLPTQIASLSVLSDVLVQEATTDTDMGRPSSVV